MVYHILTVNDLIWGYSDMSICIVFDLILKGGSGDNDLII